MATQASIGNAPERDILSVIRELEGKEMPVSQPHVDPEADTADPRGLLESLKKKAELVKLLDGYSEANDVVAMKRELGDAIDFLEQLLGQPGTKAMRR
jgi:hypothetical protein